MGGWGNDLFLAENVFISGVLALSEDTLKSEDSLLLLPQLTACVLHCTYRHVNRLAYFFGDWSPSECKFPGAKILPPCFKVPLTALEWGLGRRGPPQLFEFIKWMNR